MVSLIQLVKSKKQFSLSFRTFTRISPAVALTKGKLFTTFLTVASEHTEKIIFCLAFVLDFNNTRIIEKTFSNILYFVIGDV